MFCSVSRLDIVDLLDDIDQLPKDLPSSGSVDSVPSLEADEFSMTCPSFCDSAGIRHDRYRCTSNLFPFCCRRLTDDFLVCCPANDTNRIDEDVDDEYNCDTERFVFCSESD